MLTVAVHLTLRTWVCGLGDDKSLRSWRTATQARHVLREVMVVASLFTALPVARTERRRAADAVVRWVMPLVMTMSVTVSVPMPARVMTVVAVLHHVRVSVLTVTH